MDSLPLFPRGSPQRVTEPRIYRRTTSLLQADVPIFFGDQTQIRRFSVGEASELATELAKRNVWARHAKERDFYYQRAQALGGCTVIEVRGYLRTGVQAAPVEELADFAEKLTILASSFNASRAELQRALGVDLRATMEVSLAIGGDGQLESRSRRPPKGGGLRLDRALSKRIERNGFGALYLLAASHSELGRRIGRAVDWLFESRCEPRLEAAIVKTSVALESLLIFSESESLARSLIERVAFLISPDIEIREKAAKLVRKFYDVRSGVVHGSQKKLKQSNPPLLEAMDRVLLLALLRLAANRAKWSSKDDLQAWCERERWGSPDQLDTPFTHRHLYRALAIGVDK